MQKAKGNKQKIRKHSLIPTTSFLESQKFEILKFSPLPKESMSNLKPNIQFKNMSFLFTEASITLSRYILPFIPPVEVAFFATSFTSITLQYLGQISSARGHYTMQSTSFIWHFPWGRVAKKRALRLHRQL